METFFASPERLSNRDLQKEIELVSKHPVIDGLLHTVSGLLAVLNEQRQIISLNETLMEMLGITDAGQALGLRPGEVINCIHAHETEAGCGTSKFCSTCGAAIAIVTSLGQNKPVERICALTAQREGKEVNISLAVRSQPIQINGKRFLLLFLQDITYQQKLGAIEKVFFHDVNNMLTSLLGASQLLAIKNNKSVEADKVHHLAVRLAQEVTIQSCILRSDECNYQPFPQEITPREIFQEMNSFFFDLPASRNKILNIPDTFPDTTFRTDITLLMRVLRNMLTNAFEATEDNGEVRFWLEDGNNVITFYVWNKMAIPEDVSRRVFQPYFSTKKGAGRGFGTYTMKLLGENFLSGKVDFTSSQDKGTTFRFSLPVCN
jgi:signal transduction histidine kinase